MRKLSRACAPAMTHFVFGLALCSVFLAAGDTLAVAGEEVPDPAWSEAGCFPELPDFTSLDEDLFGKTLSHGSRRVPLGEPQDGSLRALPEISGVWRSTDMFHPRRARMLRRAGRSPPSL